jgi:hypothetical protein
MPGYSGSLCNNTIIDEPTSSARQQQRNQSMDIELGLSITFVLLLLLVGLVVLYFYLRKKAAKMSGKYYPSEEENKAGYEMTRLDLRKLEKEEKLV